MEDVAIRSQATTLKSRTYGTIHALDDIRQAATVVDKGDAAIIASMFSGEFRDLPSACKKLITELHPILGNLNAQFNDADPRQTNDHDETSATYRTSF